MNDYITNYCSTCKIEEANCFCKICSLWYCWEHHCHHLKVAHESNSYSIRLDKEINNEDQRIRTYDDMESETSISSNFKDETNQESYSIPLNLQPLGTYTTKQLEEQYDFHRNQSRRIRNELERRELFASGVVAKRWLPDTLQKRERKRAKEPIRSKKSLSNALDILLNHIRLGAVSAEQIKTQIQILQSK